MATPIQHISWLISLYGHIISKQSTSTSDACTLDKIFHFFIFISLFEGVSLILVSTYFPINLAVRMILNKPLFLNFIEQACKQLISKLSEDQRALIIS